MLSALLMLENLIVADKFALRLVCLIEADLLTLNPLAVLGGLVEALAEMDCIAGYFAVQPSRAGSQTNTLCGVVDLVGEGGNVIGGRNIGTQ